MNLPLRAWKEALATLGLARANVREKRFARGKCGAACEFERPNSSKTAA